MPDLANGNYVSQADADRQWVPAARDVLAETAREYGAWITHEELSQRIQASTGITTRQPAEEWVGRVLGKVATLAEQRGEPRLASLCVAEDQSIGKGYVSADPYADERTRERLAAEDRLDCYRWAGAEMPVDCGVATLPPLVLERLSRGRTRSTGRVRERREPARPATPALREVTCTSCFMVVPAAAECRECGSSLPAHGA